MSSNDGDLTGARRVFTALARVQHARVQEIVAGRLNARALAQAMQAARQVGATEQDLERALDLINRAAAGLV